ncbi:hypothetical protein N7451_011254 [Penicillium sp. IBT 35674x]|nr:hypothetical protein N7451_011254 [Penicillium sp. IBT 35674x]
MSSQGFSFPPPPPPPPTVSQQHPAYPSAQYGNGHWTGRGAGGRGRGRGHMNRGRAGHFSSDAGRPSYNPPSHNSTPGNYGYPPHPMSATSYMPPSPYSHAQTNYQHPPNPPSYPPQHFPQPAGSAPYQPLPGYNSANHAHPGPYSAPPAPAYSPVPSPQHASPQNTPVVMGSLHWGAEAPPSYAGPPGGHGHGNGNGNGHGHGRGGHRGSHHGNHGNHGPKSRHPGKRDHASAFNKPQSTVPRVPAPPPVPSFGNPLPCKPPPAVDATRQPKKRKRKHNLLGLTPKTDEHESSEEEEHVDEEAKAASDAGPLQITYKGKTATLQSPTDIAAWIAERKKKFPTQARIEEKKKAAEEANAAREAAREAARREKEQAKAKEIEKQTPPSNAGRKLSDAQADPALEEAKRAQRKADKIRRTLDREQKRFAKAEAEAEAARLKVAALQRKVLGLKQDQPNGAPAEPLGLSASSEGVDPVMAATDTPKEQTSLSITNSQNTTVAPDGVDAMDLMSDGSDNSDWTSSSGSESDSDSDSGCDDSAPEAISSRREGPERVAPPPREGKKQSCRHFARTGQCNRGDKCKFSHDAPKQGPKSKPVEKKGRKGLFQALVDQQKTEEDKRAMEMILWLGQNGLLEATANAPQMGA